MYVQQDTVHGSVGGTPYAVPVAGVERFEVLRPQVAASIVLSLLVSFSPFILIGLSWLIDPPHMI